MAKEIESHDGMKQIAGLTPAGDITLINIKLVGSNDTTAMLKTALAKCESAVKYAKHAQLAAESRLKAIYILAAGLSPVVGFGIGWGIRTRLKFFRQPPKLLTPKIPLAAATKTMVSHDSPFPNSANLKS